MNNPENEIPEIPQAPLANPGYAVGQLGKAYVTLQAHEDAQTREGALIKIGNWIKVITGMLSGGLQIGSRKPVKDVPVWATLEVVRGGFSTGSLLAGGELQPHEREMLRKISADKTASSRSAINAYYLTDAGLTDLQKLLSTGCYRLGLPEEGALLVIAWLLKHDQIEQASNVLDEIGPYTDHLRFYPIPETRPLPTSSLIYLQTISQTIDDLKKLKLSRRIQAQREATRVWAPLSDRVVELLLETVEGEPPTLEQDSNGEPGQTKARQPIVRGGWPCQIFSTEWNLRAKATLAEIRQSRNKHTLCGQPERHSKRSFGTLCYFLEICASDPSKLTGQDVGRIRFLLASIKQKRGLPSSEQCQRLRQVQRDLAKLPTNAELAKVVIDRLIQMPQDEGLNSLEGPLMPVTEKEAIEHEIDVGRVLRTRLETKVRRCLASTVEDLIGQGILTSSESLARVIPQITGQVRAAGLTDPELRQIDNQIYQAFRRRRSLLLLNLENQVKLEELPWIQAINRYREYGADTKAEARQTLEQVFVAAIRAFPHQILPNKLLQEIRSLATAADLKIPIVDEVAADIFMGTFSTKFLNAAQIAGKLLSGTLYERYYGIPYDQIRQFDDAVASQYGTPTSPKFDQLCSVLANEQSSAAKWSVARNGKIIEQEQIVTTHNLAALFVSLDLARSLQPELEQLARRCFKWICYRLQVKIELWQARLQTVKNTAYAWRQMIFFLALLPENDHEEFLSWAVDELEKQPVQFQMRFRPALNGLHSVIHGAVLPAVDQESGDMRRFLGWTIGKHWLLS